MAMSRAAAMSKSLPLSLFRAQSRSYSAPADRAIPAAKQKYIPTTGSYPKGFLAGSAFAGVKASNTKYDDLTLVVSEKPCAAGAVFTRNIFKAAPVRTSHQTLQQRQNAGIRGVVVNSGCANAVTGSLGLTHAQQMAAETDRLFAGEGASSAQNDATPQTLVMSTGVIGQNLPMDRISAAIPKLHPALGSSHTHWLSAASAICTTDTFPKLLSRTFTLPSHPQTEYRLAGMTKGAGMIHPNMATLLGIICTDARIHPQSIKPFLEDANRTSFNSITIDGDTSTNDTVVLLANGEAAPAEVQPLTHTSSSSPAAADDAAAFQAILRTFMTDLAQLVVRDGEGATKFVKIRVIADAPSSASASSSTSSESVSTPTLIARSIACSSLVKTALYGRDANWGRILCAVGYAAGVMPDANFSDAVGVTPSHTSVSFVPADGSPELKLLVRGEPEVVDEVRAKEILEMEDLEIVVRLEDRGENGQAGEGQKEEAVYYTCDFSHEYVTINGDYRT